MGRLDDEMGHPDPAAQPRLAEGVVSEVLDDGTVMVVLDNEPDFAYGPMDWPGIFDPSPGARALLALGGNLTEVWLVNWHA